MADIDNESQISDVPNLTEAAASEVHEQFRRTEAERVRVTAAAQGAILHGMVGDPRGAVGGGRREGLRQRNALEGSSGGQEWMQTSAATSQHASRARPQRTRTRQTRPH
jgi:hypothetical protein